MALVNIHSHDRIVIKYLFLTTITSFVDDGFYVLNEVHVLLRLFCFGKINCRFKNPELLYFEPEILLESHPINIPENSSNGFSLSPSNRLSHKGCPRFCTFCDVYILNKM